MIEAKIEEKKEKPKKQSNWMSNVQWETRKKQAKTIFNTHEKPVENKEH